MSIIIIEVPHQRSPMVWVARDEQHIIQIASEVHDFCYDEWTMKEAVDAFDDEIPSDLKMILDRDGSAMRIGYSGDGQWLALDDICTELEAAKEAICHDLSNCHFLTATEAEEFKGHADVQIVLNKFIEENDYLFKDKEVQNEL